MMMLMIMAAALVIMVMVVMVVVMVMLMIMAAALVIMVMVVVVVVMMMLMIMAAALVIIVFFVFFRMSRFVLRHQLVRKGDRLLHRVMDGLPGELIPRCGDDGGVRVLPADHRDRLIKLFLVDKLSSGKDDRPGALNLVVVELTEVLHIHTDLLYIRNGNQGTDLETALLRFLLDRPADV